MEPSYRVESSRYAGTGGHGLVATLFLPRGAALSQAHGLR